MGLFFRKKQEIHSYDRESQRPVIRASICTGERTAGFQDIRTGKITEVMLIRTPADLERFRQLYGIAEDEIRTEY
ncbi:aspartate dehydrogenase [Fournierella sp.]|uniref:aspartate dehydrogenase n=1 Tax=Allofournierella sp. TaxID=1940256 RepID=UPI0025BC38C3|nr:aspartate dehydrogenase [Fournierella sp.]